MVYLMPKITLVVDTSTSHFGVVFGKGREVLFDSCGDAALPEKRDLSFVVHQGLNVIGSPVNDIRTVAVNIGPGGLSSLRSGVAFANALAFGLEVPVCPFTAFDLMGFESCKKVQLPVVCTVRAYSGNAYVGVYDKGTVTSMRFGLLEDIVKKLTQNLVEFSVAGAHRDLIQDLLPNSRIHDSGIQTGQAKTFFEMNYPIPEQGNTSHYFASPINEQSEMLDE